MVHGIHKGGRVGGVYCAIVVQYYCKSVAITGGGRQTNDDGLVHKSVAVNESLVKATPPPGIQSVVWVWSRTTRNSSRPAFTCLCADPGSGPSEMGEHRPIEWGRRVCGGLSSTLGVARCGRSAGCVLCAPWAVSAAVLGSRESREYE